MENKKDFNFTLTPIKQVLRLDTKKLKSYIQKVDNYISHLKKEYKKQDEQDATLEKVQNYKKELKKILNNRKHIE